MSELEERGGALSRVHIQQRYVIKKLSLKCPAYSEYLNSRKLPERKKIALLHIAIFLTDKVRSAYNGVGIHANSGVFETRYRRHVLHVAPTYEKAEAACARFGWRIAHQRQQAKPKPGVSQYRLEKVWRYLVFTGKLPFVEYRCDVRTKMRAEDVKQYEALHGAVTDAELETVDHKRLKYNRPK